MIQPKLEFANGQPWENYYGSGGFKWVSSNLIKKVYPPEDWSQIDQELFSALEDKDEFDTVYLFGYHRFGGFNIDTYKSLEEAFNSAKFGLEEGYCSPDFVIDPHEGKLYNDPYDDPERYIEID